MFSTVLNVRQVRHSCSYNSHEPTLLSNTRYTPAGMWVDAMSVCINLENKTLHSFCGMCALVYGNECGCVCGCVWCVCVWCICGRVCVRAPGQAGTRGFGRGHAHRTASGRSAWRSKPGRASLGGCQTTVPCCPTSSPSGYQKNRGALNKHDDPRSPEHCVARRRRRGAEKITFCSGMAPTAFFLRLLRFSAVRPPCIVPLRLSSAIP